MGCSQILFIPSGCLAGEFAPQGILPCLVELTLRLSRSKLTEGSAPHFAAPQIAAPQNSPIRRTGLPPSLVLICLRRLDSLRRESAPVESGQNLPRVTRFDVKNYAKLWMIKPWHGACSYRWAKLRAEKGMLPEQQLRTDIRH